MWLGGMYDTGVSKRLHAAFGILAGVQQPGDIGSTGRYFAADICDPRFEFVDGAIRVNPEGHEHGLGCDLDMQVLEQLAIDHWTLA